MTTEDPDPLARATALAEGVLLPRATDVDRGRVPLAPNLDELAAAGLYGLHAPSEVGGVAADARTADRVVAALAGGCLTTAFTWIQHQGVVRRLAASDDETVAHWLPRLATGDARAGVAIGGVRPGRDHLTATATGDCWRLDGTIPWVTGWGHVDVLLVAAVEADGGDVVWLLVDCPPVADPDGALRSEVDTMTTRRVDVVACDRANSAVVELTAHPVGGDRLVQRQPYDEWREADAAGLRTNGSLALGVALRCATMVADDRLAAAVEQVRAELDDADTERLPHARAAASSLAWHAAQVLLVHTGGRALATSADAQRLAREAAFLQVFGSRPAIRSAHLAALAARHGPGRVPGS